MRDTFDFMNERPERARLDDQAQSVKLTDLTLVFHHDTASAILVSETGEESSAVWLPKSQAQIKRTGRTITAHRRNGQVLQLPEVEVTCPTWLAKEKGLI